MTPEEIKGKLFSLEIKAHSLHQDTKSYAEHKALGRLYESISGMKDDFLEKLMGYMNGKRIGKAKIDGFPEYSQEAVTELVKEGMQFTKDLYEFAETKEYCDLSNMAQELSGSFAKCRYLLTLS